MTRRVFGRDLIGYCRREHDAWGVAIAVEWRTVDVLLGPYSAVVRW